MKKDDHPKTWLAFLDISKGFDRVFRNRLFCLEQTNMYTYLSVIFSMLLSDLAHVEKHLALKLRKRKGYSCSILAKQLSRATIRDWGYLPLPLEDKRGTKYFHYVKHKVDNQRLCNIVMNEMFTCYAQGHSASGPYYKEIQHMLNYAGIDWALNYDAKRSVSQYPWLHIKC